MLLLLHVLMLSLLSGGSGRVVQDFESECGQFFANGKSPTKFAGPQYRQICQMHNDFDYYATFYDTYNKIPVYSAYKFEGIKHCRRQSSWYIEPQIDDNNEGSNMASEWSVDIQVGHRQALNGDYSGSGFHRGHLAPVYLANSQRCAYATFTLTNAAPQASYFNSVLWWWNVEQLMAQYLESECDSQLVYIVTGVVPGTRNINNRVNIPSNFWTAYCCLDQNNKCSDSGGFIGTNENNSIIEEMIVADLEERLRNLYRRTFQLFQ